MADHRLAGVVIGSYEVPGAACNGAQFSGALLRHNGARTCLVKFCDASAVRANRHCLRVLKSLGQHATRQKFCEDAAWSLCCMFNLWVSCVQSDIRGSMSEDGLRQI